MGALNQVIVVLSDRQRTTLRGRRAALVAWLIEHGEYLEGSDYGLGKLEMNWGQQSLDVRCTRFDRVKRQPDDAHR